MMRTPALFIALLIAAQAAIAEPLGDCHLDRSGPIGVREDVAERLQIAQLKADLHAEQLKASGIESSFAASRRALPSAEQLKASFEADSVAWRYACRSPQVVAFDRALTRSAARAAEARMADMARAAQ